MAVKHTAAARGGDTAPLLIRRGWPPEILIALLVTEGAALGVITGLAGSPVWRVVRLLVVAALTLLAVWLVSPPGGRQAWPGARASRRSQAERGGAAFVAGITGAVTGLPITVAYLGTGRANMTLVAALAAGVTGVMLLLWGAALLIRAVPGWWRLLALPVALALLVFVIYPLTMAVFATNRPPGPPGSVTPASYGLAYRTVTFRTSDGVRLAAWYLPSRNRAAVVLLPGAGEARSSLASQAAVLARQGYGALLMDTRGHGGSGGNAMDFGWYGTRDIIAAVSFLARQPGVDPRKIALLGLSMGGEQAIVAAGTDHRIRAVVAEGVTGEQLADHGWLPRGIDGVAQRGLEWVMYTAAGLMSAAPHPMSIRDSIVASGRPVLIIAGGAIPDEPQAARWFRTAAPDRVTVWVAPHTGHTAALATQQGGWESHVLGFLRASLSPRALPR